MTDPSSILSQMTLEEKAALCTGATPWTTTPIPRLGVPELMVSDGPHGVRHPKDPSAITSESHPATCFPTASNLACTWDVALLEEMGKALAEECIALGVDVLLGPGNNMKRSPLGGRNFEYFSEDPYLAGELAASLAGGIQSKGVGTSLKHFAANNQEKQRFVVDALVDERTLREIYLPAFEKVVKKVQPWTVMCAYNKLNGSFCSEHRQLLVDILKDEWGFEGFVVSDWGAVRDRLASLKGGLDLEMPGPKANRVKAVVEAVRSGELDEAILDESVRRILAVVFKAAQTPKGAPFNIEAHHNLARKIAAEGIVLLKNEGILPLQRPQQVAVIGRSAESPRYQGGGSSHINPTRVDVPFKEMQNRADQAEFSYAAGYSDDMRFQQVLIDEAVLTARGADVAVLYMALPDSVESEGYDRPNLDLTPQQVALIKAVTAIQPNTVVVLNTGSPVVMDEWIDGAAAVVQAWMMGQAGAGALADVLFGVVNPCGKLAETFPHRLEDTPAFLNFPGESHVVRHGEGQFIGYRYYDARQAPVLFPFGYGLSYTTFAYSNLRLSASRFTDTDGLSVSVDITNTGKTAGKEIVQVYVHDQDSTLVRPPKELKGFAKVALEPGETKTVSIHLDFRAFAFYHTGHKQWITEDGEFDILVGASSADIRCQAVVSLVSSLALPSLLDAESTIGEWLHDPRGKVVFQPMFDDIARGMGAMMGGDPDRHDESVAMDMMGFLLDMPLVSVLHFQDSLLPATPEAIVAGLLQQVQAL